VLRNPARTQSPETMWRNPGRAHACGMPGGLPPHRLAASRDVRSPSGLRTSTVSRQFLLRSELREAASRKLLPTDRPL